MATLTKSTGTVTLSGAVEKVTLPAVFGWIWVKNMSDADMFLGLSESVSAGADGVLSIPAGECGRVQTDGQDSVYLIGSGNALVVAQNYAECPFKLGAKGGEMPDLSVYALKSKYGDTTINVGRKADTEIGFYSTAEGYSTTASSNYSHAEGRDTTASGNFAHAEGGNTTASGGFSHTEGSGTTASGEISHAEGSGTTASGEYSHAEGRGTTASGSSSHAGGTGTKALKDNEVAFGCFNESNDDTLYSIGDGAGDSARHNAFEITKTGGKLHDEEIMTQNKISNPNLLINPDFKINQRGVSGAFSETGKYFVDRWRLVSGAVTVNADGTLTLNGTISQIFENAVGDNVTASVSAGTATYDNSTKTFSITANGEIISWAKLEYGSNATQFFPPDPATELLKCMRYYEAILVGVDRAFPAFFAPDRHVEADISFKVPKRIAPSLIINGIRIVVATSTGHITSSVAFQLYQSDIYGMTINTVDPIVAELPSYLLGVTLDGSFAVDTEIY